MFFVSMGLAIAPILAIFIFFYVKDTFNKEPAWILLVSFFLGIFIAFPVYYIGEGLHMFFEPNDSSHVLIKLLYAIGMIGLVEEGMKFLVLRGFCYPRPSFDEPYDGIMYGVTISLGFAAIENVLYVYTGGMDVGLLRMFTAVPAHAVFGVVMGYFMGLAKYAPTKKKGIGYMATGVGLAVLFHGLYDFFLFLNWGYIALVSFVLLAIGIFLSLKAVKIHKANSPHLPLDE